ESDPTLVGAQFRNAQQREHFLKCAEKNVPEILRMTLYADEEYQKELQEKEQARITSYEKTFQEEKLTADTIFRLQHVSFLEVWRSMDFDPPKTVILIGERHQTKSICLPQRAPPNNEVLLSFTEMMNRIVFYSKKNSIWDLFVEFPIGKVLHGQ